MRFGFAAVAAMLLAGQAHAATFSFNFLISRPGDASENLLGKGTFTADDGTAEGDGTRYTLTGASGTATPSWNVDEPYSIVGLFDYVANSLLVTDAGITFDQVGLFLDGGPSILVFNADGEVFVGETFYQTDSLSIEQATGAVPEPATWAMMLAGFGLTGAAMRRRRAAPAFA